MKNTNMTVEERRNRVLARGEFSNHSHILTGDVLDIKKDENGKVTWMVGPDGAILKHLMEREYVERGQEVWTKEHADINLPPGEYEFVNQVGFNPYTKTIEQVKD